MSLASVKATSIKLHLHISANNNTEVYTGMCRIIATPPNNGNMATYLVLYTLRGKGANKEVEGHTYHISDHENCELIIKVYTL